MRVQPKQYAQLLYELTEKTDDPQKLDILLAKFVDSMKQQQDQRKLEQVITEFQRIFQEKQKLVLAQVVTASPMASAQRSQLKDVLAKKYQTTVDKVELEETIDHSMTGGLVVKVGNEVWDSSIQQKIERLKSQLSK